MENINVYVKLVNGQLEKAPTTIGNNQFNVDKNLNWLKENGYKLFVADETIEDNKNYSVSYVEKEETIEEICTLLEEPKTVVTKADQENIRRQLYVQLTDGKEAELAYKLRKGYPQAEIEQLSTEIDQIRSEIQRRYPDPDNSEVSNESQATA